MKAYDKLLKAILDEYQIVRFTETNYIFEDGSKITRQKFRDEIFPIDMERIEGRFLKKDPEFYEMMGSSTATNRRTVKSRFFEDLEGIVKDSVNATSNANYIGEEEAEKCSITTSELNLSGYKLFKHITNNRYEGCEVLYNLSTGSISNISPDLYMDTLRPDERAVFKPLYAVFEYDPYNIAPIRPMVFEGLTVNRVNTYLPPDWRKLNVEYSKTPPKLFSLFMRHLFPEAESRRFVISWMRNAILNRAETVLILNGAKGTGKNVFVDFLKELVGAENFGRAKTSLIKKEFNSMLEDKRLIFFDEIKIDKKGHTFLKDACNSEHNIEKKGKDANNLTPTYFSIIAANNDTTDIHLEPDDRRFSTPNITGETLNVGMPNEEDRRQLIALQSDPLAIKEIGEFIISYIHDAYSDPFYAFMPEKFHKLVFTSLHAWQQHIFDKVANSTKPMNIDHIREDANESRMLFPHTNSKIENFLQNYQHRGLFRIGSLEKEGEGSKKKTMLCISDEFKTFLSGAESANTTTQNDDVNEGDI